jgi:hypothetical protein
MAGSDTLRLEEQRMEPDRPLHNATGTSFATLVVLGVAIFAILVANGRPIIAGDTRANDRVAASLAREGNFDLNEYPEARGRFEHVENGRRYSIYPALPSVMAAPVFWLVGLGVDLDDNGMALAGKLSAALMSTIAALLLFVSVARRHDSSAASLTAILFAVGTSVYSVSQDLWQHPAALLFLCWALVWLVMAEDDAVWAGRAALPLGLVVAARYADVALVAAILVVTAVRFPRRIPALALWGLPGPVLAAVLQWMQGGALFGSNVAGFATRFDAPWGVGQLGLLLSPAKGLLIFTPLVLVGVLGWGRMIRYREHGLALTLALGTLAHWILLGRWGEWHGGWCWGPRMMTDALPLIFLALPVGWQRVPRLSIVLAALSVGVQLIGGFSYDYRWERLHPDAARGGASLWSWSDGPLPFHLRERVAILAWPARDGRHVRFLERRFVIGGSEGGMVSVGEHGLEVSGSERLLGDAQLIRGARVTRDSIDLNHRRSALFARLLPAARDGRHQLCVAGKGHGAIFVGEGSTTAKVVWSRYHVRGAFVVCHEIGEGPEVLVAVQRKSGILLDSVTVMPRPAIVVSHGQRGDHDVAGPDKGQGEQDDD